MTKQNLGHHSTASVVTKAPVFAYKSSDELLSIDWNILDSTQLMCGSTSGEVTFFDVRGGSPSYPKVLRSHKFGKASVRSVKYSPFDKNIFGVGSDF